MPPRHQVSCMCTSTSLRGQSCWGRSDSSQSPPEGGSVRCDTPCGPRRSGMHVPTQCQFSKGYELCCLLCQDCALVVLPPLWGILEILEFTGNRQIQIALVDYTRWLVPWILPNRYENSCMDHRWRCVGSTGCSYHGCSPPPPPPQELIAHCSSHHSPFSPSD